MERLGKVEDPISGLGGGARGDEGGVEYRDIALKSLQ